MGRAVRYDDIATGEAPLVPSPVARAAASVARKGTW